jgi:TPR repeat protein
MYARGEGVARDAAKSRYWARKARESRARDAD